MTTRSQHVLGVTCLIEHLDTIVLSHARWNHKTSIWGTRSLKANLEIYLQPKCNLDMNNWISPYNLHIIICYQYIWGEIGRVGPNASTDRNNAKRFVDFTGTWTWNNNEKWMNPLRVRPYDLADSSWKLKQSWTMCRLGVVKRVGQTLPRSVLGMDFNSTRGVVHEVYDQWRVFFCHIHSRYLTLVWFQVFSIWCRGVKR